MQIIIWVYRINILLFLVFFILGNGFSLRLPQLLDGLQFINSWLFLLGTPVIFIASKLLKRRILMNKLDYLGLAVWLVFIVYSVFFIV